MRSIDVAYCNRRSSVIGLCVCVSVYIILLLIKLPSLHKSLLDFFYYVSDRMNNFTTNVKLRMSEC